MKPNYQFKEITQEESLIYLKDESFLPTINYPKNPTLIMGELGFSPIEHRRIVVKIKVENVFNYKREGIEDRKIAQLFGLNLKSKFHIKENNDGKN